MSDERKPNVGMERFPNGEAVAFVCISDGDPYVWAELKPPPWTVWERVKAFFGHPPKRWEPPK